jgi:NADPH-dependent curcumin reductase CurA
VSCAGDDKCSWAVREAGYDACFNHRTEHDCGAVLDRLCPRGIDADFENVGGKIFHAVFARLNNFGRVAFCGAISEYQDQAPMAGPTKMFTIVQRRLTLQGFIVSDHVALMGEFVNEVGALLKDGKLKSRETVVDGLARAPEPSWACSRARISAKLGEGRDIDRAGSSPAHVAYGGRGARRDPMEFLGET